MMVVSEVEGNEVEIEIKPWMVAMVSPEQAVFFFDDHTEAVNFAERYKDSTTCVIASAIAVLGPLNGVGVQPFPKKTRT